MALVFDAPVTLEDAITFVQEQPIPSNNALTNMFPARRDFDSDEVDFAHLTRTNRILRFRNWDGAFKPVPRDTFREQKVRMLPLGGFLEVGEYERRQIEFAATGGTRRQRMIDAIYNDLEHLTRYAYNRLELAWGDVLTDGILTINEDGVNQSTNYGLAGSHNVTPGTLWSNTATSTPLTNLLAWVDQYVATNGAMPGRFLTSLEVLRLLMKNTELINAIRGSTVGVTMVTLPEINARLASYGLPGFDLPPAGSNVGGSVYNSSLDVDGVTTRVLAANKLLMLPSDLSTLGFTAFGIPTTAMELNEKNVQTEVGPGLVGIIVREANPPYRKHTYVDGVALPILADVRKLFVATVTA